MPSQFQDYFNDRINQEIEKNALVGVSTKYDEVQKAATDKIAQLEVAHKQALKIRELQANSWVGKLGLDPDGLAGEALNKTASFVSGASTQLGNLASLPTSISAAMDEAQLSPVEMEAYNRHVQGIATPQDMELLNTRKGFYTDSPLQIAERMNTARGVSNAITKATDISSIVHSKQRDALTDDMGADFQAAWDQTGLGNLFDKNAKIGEAKDVAEGLAKLVYNAGAAAVKHPSGAVEYIAENIPQLLAGSALKHGTKLLTAANAGYALDNYNKGIEKYQAENSGAMPPPEERQKMALWAASTAVAEQLGELGQLKAIGKVRTAADLAKDSTETGLLKSIGNVAKAGATGYGEEALTEGYQTYAEAQAKREPVSAKDVYIGAGIGGLAGGGTSMGGRAIAEALGATPEKQQKRVEETKRSEVYAEAAKTGNVDQLLDPKSMHYNPSNAIDALLAHTQADGTTPEVKAANIAKVNEIVAGLEQKREEVAKNYFRVSDEGIKQLQEERQQAIDAGETEQVKIYDEQLADILKDTKSEPRLRKQLDQIDQYLNESKSARNLFQQEWQSKQVDIDTALQKIKSADKVESHAAVNDVINLSMAIPERLSKDTATQLANDESLTQQQRSYFRAFNEARVAEHQAKDGDAVNDDILYGDGSNGYVGIDTYRKEVFAALQAGDQAGAIKLLAQLNKFATDHTSKAEESIKALKAVGDGAAKSIQIRSDGQGRWFQHTGPLLNESERQAEGAFTIHKGSAKQVNAFRLEARAINAALKELQAAVDIQVVPTSEATDVKDVSPAEGSTEVKAQPAAEAKAQEGESEGTGSTGTGTTEPTVQSNEQAAADEAAKTDGVTEEAPASSAKTAEAKSTETSTEEGQLQSTETAAETTTTEATDEQQQGLSVLKAKSAEEELPAGTKVGEVFSTLNRAVAFLKQTKQRIDNDSDIAKDRPLVSIPGFLTKWNNDDVLASDMFIDNLTEEEIGALNTFKKFATQWAPIVRANLIKGGLPNMKGNLPTEEFKFEDPIQDFFNEDGSIDENLVTAIVYGAYSWLSVSANGPKLKDNESILKMLGIQEGAGVTVASGMNPLRTMTTFQDAAANSMGRYVIDALGLKPNGKQTVDYMGRLTTAFGLQAMVLLANDKVNAIDTVSISGNDMNTYLPGLDVQPVGKTKSGRDVYPEYEFVRINVDSSLKLQGVSKEVQESTVQSHGVLQRMFSTERPKEFASWKPMKFTQGMAKKTKQAIPKLLRKILNEAMQAPQRVIPSMWDALTVLGDEVFLKAAGWTEYQEDKVQVENRENILAKNHGLEDQLDNMKALVSDAIKNSPDGLSQPFYIAQEVWRNFRVGMAANDLNLQSSKIHRFSFFRPEWESKIDLNDKAAENSFLISVAQAFGIKIDQQANDKTLDKLIDMVNEDEGRISNLAYDLAEALATPDQQKLTEGQKQEIAEFTANAEGMQTLQALVAYGKFLQAKEAGAPEVTVHMLVGVDGKTNGPILTQLALGAAITIQELFKRLNRGGMYKDSDGVENYNHWYERLTSLDLYEDLAFHILNGIEPNAALNAINVFTKKLVDEEGKVTSAGRKLAKTPLTAFVFGSSIDGSVRSMQEAFVQSVFDRIQAVATGVDKKTKTADIVASLNMMMGTKLPANTTIEQLMQRRFSDKEKKALMSAFHEQIGSRVEDTMKQYFGTFLDRRNSVNRSIQGAFQIYNAIYQDLRAQEMNRLMDEGGIDFVMRKGERIPKHNMQVEQEAALRERVAKIMPLANTAYTVGNDELNAGLYMAKTSQTMSNAMFDSVKVQLGQRIPTKNGYPVSTISGRATVQTETSPGVAGLPYFMHSLDSYIMHLSLQGSQTLNVHDEAANGVSNVEKTAEAINKATWQGMLKFSPVSEAYDLLTRTVLNAAELIESGNLSNDTLGQIANTLRAQLPFKQRSKVSDENLASTVIGLAHAAQLEANRVRLETMAQMAFIDQYTWEGGQYKVTDKDRQDAKDALERLLEQSNPAADVMAAADAIGAALAKNAYKKKPIKVESGSTSQPSQAGTSAIKIEADRTSVFGQLGKPSIKSDADLVNYLSRNPKATAGEMISILSQPGRLNPINRKLLQLVSRVVPKDLPITYVTAKTREEDVLAKANGPSRGWYVVKGNAESIYVLSPEFKDSGLTAETLLHELIHAAVAKTIAAPSKEAAALVAELETLRIKAREFLGLDRQHSNQSSDRDYEASLDALQKRVNEVFAKEFAEFNKLDQNPNMTEAEQDRWSKLDTLIQKVNGAIDVASGERILVQTAEFFEKNLPSELHAELLSKRKESQSRIAAGRVNPLALQFADALSNVQEFVAWGMSNLQFQRDVLTKITMESKTKGNALVTGMQKFIETLGKLLFKNPDAQVNNGLNVLVGNVSGLFYEAGKAGSKASEINLSMATVESVLELNTQEIFQALDNGAVSTKFQAHLAEVLTDIQDRLHGPFGSFLAQFRGTEATNPLAAWLKTIETGNAPFASKIVASGMAGSAQEDFVMQQVEATVKAMLNGTEATTTAVYTALSKLYTEVRNKLTPQDFIDAGLTAADYDFVFKLESDNGEKSDYMARFMAMGLGHEKFAKLLAFNTAQDTSPIGSGATLFDKMVNIFDKIVEFFRQKITHTYGGQPADAKLKALMEDLVAIEAKKRHSLARKAAGEVGVVARFEKATKNAVNTVKSAATDLVESKIIKQNRLQTVRAVGTGVKVFTKGQVDEVMARFRQMRDMRNNKRDDVLDGLAREVRGPFDRFKMLLIEAKKNEATRKDIIAQHARMTLKAFKDEGKTLSRDAKAAISAVLLRTGAHNLLNHFSMAQIENLISDPAALDGAIAQFQGRLSTGLKDAHIQQANHLGFYKATGKNTADVLMFNAHVIARMFNTQYAGQITEQQAAAEEPVIAVLATLYSIKYQSELDRKQAAEILRTENLRTDGNGVLFTLELYKELEKDSLQNLFAGNPTLMVHGYTPEIVNPHTEIRVAGRREGLSLMRQGYVKGAKLGQDPSDPDPVEKHIYVLRDGGLAPWLSGFLSLTSMQAKGSEMHNGFLNVNTVNGLDNAQVNAQILNDKVVGLRKVSNPGRDLSKQMGGSKLAPTYNDKGEIVNWRYLMLENTRNTVLERDNSFDQIMGAYAGGLFDKVATQDQNEVAARAMREQYELDRATNPTAYVEVGERSSDPEMRELWRLLPQGTRDAIESIWGRKGMLVRKDSLDITFGYRKLSVGDFLRKDQAALKGMPKVAREIFNHIATMRGMSEQQANDWANRLSIAIIRGERGWQEVVHEIKDMVVVKNLTTLLGNIYSNDSLLFMLGVENRWHHQWVAIKGVLDYQAKSERLAEIEAIISTGYTYVNMTELQREAVKLRDSLARNPVKPLIDAGMMPTIVEDVEAEVDPYSYKTQLARKVEQYTDRIPESIKAAGRLAYMTHDTKLYKFLSKTTQYSDFVARYALYQHLTNRAENPLSHEDAISETSDAFVNYDIPTHRILQYTDDMGFTPFIKYFLRIQRFLMKTARENPARVMSLVLLGRFWDLGPIVLDSSFVAHIGNNPFTTGALRYFSTLDELLTAKAAMALVK